MKFRLFALCVVLGASSLRADDDSSRFWNAGKPGNTASQVLGRLTQDVLAKKPRLVVLLVGTNDALNSQKATSVEVFREKLRDILSQINSSGAKSLVLTVPPCYPPYLFLRHAKEFYRTEGPNAAVRSANQAVSEVAEELKVPVVDIYTLFEKEGNIGEDANSYLRNQQNSGTSDGVHPTEKGYAAIAEEVYKTIVAKNLPTKEIVCVGDSITYGVGTSEVGTCDGATYPAVLKRLLTEQASKQ